MQRHKAIIAYDISDNKRRYRVHRVMKAWGLAAQYSVFDCELSDNDARNLFQHLSQLIDPTEDSLMLAWLDKQRSTRLITVSQVARTDNSSLWYDG